MAPLVTLLSLCLPPFSGYPDRPLQP